MRMILLVLILSARFGSLLKTLRRKRSSSLQAAWLEGCLDFPLLISGVGAGRDLHADQRLARGQHGTCRPGRRSLRGGSLDRARLSLLHSGSLRRRPR